MNLEQVPQYFVFKKFRRRSFTMECSFIQKLFHHMPSWSLTLEFKITCSLSSWKKWFPQTRRDNTKIFSQFMSKSRSLAKIGEKRLHPLLVWEIIYWKLSFSTLLQGQSGGGHGTVPPCVRLWLNAPFFCFAPVQCPYCPFQHEPERGAK